MKKFALIIGHRGAMGHAPENTRASFEAGVRLGADAVECDVHLTKDGRLVVIHDDRLDRTTNGRGAVSGKTWTELRTLDAGAWFGKAFGGERLWLLEELLWWAKKHRTRAGAPLRVIVEMKADPLAPVTLADRTVSVLRKTGMVRRAFVISFNHKEAARAKALCPRVRTGLLFSKTPRDLVHRMAWSRADAVFPRFNRVTPALMKEAHARGWFVGTWTVNEIPEMKRLLNLGVNAMASNFPERAVCVIGSASGEVALVGRRMSSELTREGGLQPGRHAGKLRSFLKSNCSPPSPCPLPSGEGKSLFSFPSWGKVARRAG